MLVDEFMDEPTGKNHSVYADSLFSTIAPEYSTSEVLIGSAYRKLILGIHDNSVDLERIPQLPNQMPAIFGDPELWNQLLLEDRGLASPGRSGQRGAAVFRQLMPLVPAEGRYAAVLGRIRNRWFPANLLMQVIGAGRGPTEGKLLIERLGGALKVDEQDDIFARFVANAFDAIEPSPATPPFMDLEPGGTDTRAFRGHVAHRLISSPAEQFCNDIEGVLGLKSQLTRRQWIVLVEAIFRLGLGAHVLWVCQVNGLFWDLVLSVVGGALPPSSAVIESAIWESHHTFPLLEVGRDGIPLLRQLIEKYVYARFGLNLLLFRLEDIERPWPRGGVLGFSTHQSATVSEVIHSFLHHIAGNRQHIDPSDPHNAQAWLRFKCTRLLDERLSLAKCEVGFTKNLLEFSRHILGQIETENPEQRSYDQSYVLVNPRRRRSRPIPYIVQPGPAMLILLVYACCKTHGAIPTSLEDFRMHLANYGLHAPAGELLTGQVGNDLESLGLVVDSPDAAGGRLLVPPF